MALSFGSWRSRRVPENVVLWSISFVLAVLFWLWTSREEKPIRDFNVPLIYTRVPEDLVISGEFEDQILWVAVVVSEERGSVSYVEEGAVRRDLHANEVKERLLAALVRPRNGEQAGESEPAPDAQESRSTSIPPPAGATSEKA